LAMRGWLIKRDLPIQRRAARGDIHGCLPDPFRWDWTPPAGPGRGAAMDDDQPHTWTCVHLLRSFLWRFGQKQCHGAGSDWSSIHLRIAIDPCLHDGVIYALLVLLFCTTPLSLLS
jgi:hypothetical protein